MTAHSDKGSARDLKKFGWQGMVLTIPEGWELVSTRGDYRSGYAGLADETAVRLEMKWEAAEGKSEPSEVAAQYIRTLRKKARKDGTEITVGRDIKLATIKGKDIECYEWAADRRGIGMASRCDECERMVHIVVLGRGDEALRKLCRRIFSSLKDHPEDDDELLWRFYDVEFCSPAALPLERQDLKTGCIRMRFAKRGTELEFIRVSLASIALARQGLAEWLDGFYRRSLKRMSYRLEEVELKDHPAVYLEGKAWLITNPAALLGRRRETRVACWHCEPSNRLFLVRHTAPRGEQKAFERAVNGVKCCAQR